MKSKHKYTTKNLKAMMNQGTGPKAATLAEGDLKELMKNGGKSPSCDIGIQGKRGVRKYMGQ